MLGCAAHGLNCIGPTEARDQLQFRAGLTRSVVAGLNALVVLAVERLQTGLFAAELGPFRDMARHSLRSLQAVAFDRHIDVARRTGARVTEDLAGLVHAVLVLLFLAVLATGVRQDKRVVGWLREAPAEARVLGHAVLCVGKVAVRTRPVEKGQELLGLSLELRALVTRVFVVVLFLLFLVSHVFFERLVELLDPALDAAQVERRIALLAVPNGRALENLVLANDALLVA